MLVEHQSCMGGRSVLADKTIPASFPEHALPSGWLARSHCRCVLPKRRSELLQSSRPTHRTSLFYSDATADILTYTQVATSSLSRRSVNLRHCRWLRKMRSMFPARDNLRLCSAAVYWRLSRCDFFSSVGLYRATSAMQWIVLRRFDDVDWVTDTPIRPVKIPRLQQFSGVFVSVFWGNYTANRRKERCEAGVRACCMTFWNFVCFCSASKITYFMSVWALNSSHSFAVCCWVDIILRARVHRFYADWSY